MSHTRITQTSSKFQRSSNQLLRVQPVLYGLFPHMAAKLADRSPSTASMPSTTQSGATRGYVTQYLSYLGTPGQQNATEFWQQRVGNSSIPLIALDISAPASQAFAERLFSVSGILTSGRRNRTSKSLHIRTWLKVNYGELSYMLSSAKTC